MKKELLTSLLMSALIFSTAFAADKNDDGINPDSSKSSNSSLALPMLRSEELRLPILSGSRSVPKDSEKRITEETKETKDSLRIPMLGIPSLSSVVDEPKPVEQKSTVLPKKKKTQTPNFVPNNPFALPLLKFNF